EAGDDERSMALRAQDERDWTLGGREGEADVVEDVVGVEENCACEPVAAEPLEQGLAARAVLVGRDRDRGLHNRSLRAGRERRHRCQKTPSGETGGLDHEGCRAFHECVMWLRLP